MTDPKNQISIDELSHDRSGHDFMSISTTGYVLESGDHIDQFRYRELQRKLDTMGGDRRSGLPKVAIHRENVDLCGLQIPDMFYDSAPIVGSVIREQMAYLGHRDKTTKKALKSLREKGILSLHWQRYHFLESKAEPLEVGAPIVFLPGTKSQKIGHIVELKELRNGPKGFHPVAVLESGQKMFVNPDSARVDASQKAIENHLGWLMKLLSTAVDRKSALTREAICRSAFEKGIPQISTTIKEAMKSGRINRGHRRVAGTFECCYWRNI